MAKKIQNLLLIGIALAVLGLGIYQLPPVKSRLEWRIPLWIEKFQHALNPPEEVVFVPSSASNPQLTEIARQVDATLQALASPTSSPTISPPAPIETTPTLTPLPSDTPTPTISPTALPASLKLSGIRHEYETWNNCGPATIGMQLSFWGWPGNQAVSAAWLKPNPRDKNVSPLELKAYVEEETEFRAIYRQGGNPQMLKGLVAAGFPTIIEKTLDLQGVDGWIGHYALITGYNDETEKFYSYDSYIQPDLPEPYAKLENAWRSFNYTFLVVYPEEREQEVFSILGPLADEEQAFSIALERAEREIEEQVGLDYFFAWFNKGSSLTGLGDYFGAAAAFDNAFAVYGQLPAEERPWRMVWYQHGPYLSYFQAGRYEDVIALADTTLSTMGEQTIEETFYWRGLAYEQLGYVGQAYADIEQAVSLNSNYTEALKVLDRMNNP